MILRLQQKEPVLAVIRGTFFVLPFVILNWIISHRIEPVFSFIRPGLHTSVLEYILLAFVLLLLPIGAYVVFSPSLQNNVVKRKFYLVNTIVAALLVIVFILLVGFLGQEIYRCDVLKVPYCD